MQPPSSQRVWLLPALALLIISSSCSDQSPTAPSATLRAAISHPPQVPPGPPADAGKPPTISFVTTVASLVVNTSGGLTVQVVDKKGAPLAGRPVSWSSVNDGGAAGSFNPAQGVTDATGRASTTFTAGTSAAVEHVTAASGGSTASSDVSVLPGPATNLIKIGTAGNGEPLFQCTPTLMTVKVADQYGNGIAGHMVSWYDPATPHIVLSSPTIAGGLSSATWSPETLGLQTTEAAAVDASNVPLIGSPVAFSFTIVEDPDGC